VAFGGTIVAAPLIAGTCGINDTCMNHGSDPQRQTANLRDVILGLILTALRGAGIRGG